VSALPVVERRRLVGLVTLVDVLGPCARALAGVAAT
jgi:CBS domain-containing protein